MGFSIRHTHPQFRARSRQCAVVDISRYADPAIPSGGHRQPCCRSHRRRTRGQDGRGLQFCFYRPVCSRRPDPRALCAAPGERVPDALARPRFQIRGWRDTQSDCASAANFGGRRGAWRPQWFSEVERPIMTGPLCLPSATMRRSCVNVPRLLPGQTVARRLRGNHLKNEKAAGRMRRQCLTKDGSRCANPSDSIPG
jgi:hypothetical protein